MSQHMKQQRILEAMRKNKVLEAYVQYWDPNQKGLVVLLEIGVEAFIPAEECSIYPLKHPISKQCPSIIKTFLQKKILVQILKVEEDFSKIIVSHKPIMQGMYDEIHEGDQVEEEIVAMTNYGFFIRIGELVGYCYLSEISSSRVFDIHKRFSVGQKVTVYILKKDDTNHQITLSYRRCFPDNLTKYKPKEMVTGWINGRLPSKDGYFVEISPNVKGIVDTVDELPIGTFVLMKVRAVTARGLRLILIGSYEKDHFVSAQMSMVS